MKKIKNTVSVFLCAVMLISMCAIGANGYDFVIDEGTGEGTGTGDVVTDDSYRMDVRRFTGSGGNVLIASLVNLTLSDASDLTITLYGVGTNDTRTRRCVFTADETIVEQPNEAHSSVELYLKNDKVPDAGDYVLRVESGSLTDSNGETVSLMDSAFICEQYSSEISYSFDCEEASEYVVGSGFHFYWIGCDAYFDRLTVTTDTPDLLSVGDDKTVTIVGTGDARFTAKYNDFVYETWTFKTYRTKLAYYLATHTVHSTEEYFDNLGSILPSIIDVPVMAGAISVIALPLFPIVFPVVLVGMLLYYFASVFCAFFGVILSPSRIA